MTATVQVIKDLQPVIGTDADGNRIIADAIELVTFRDVAWQCVVKKGEFHITEPCIYVEIDSVLPQRPEFEFMKARGYRVKTVRFLRTTLSQGLVFPYKMLEPYFGKTADGIDVLFPVGAEVGELLGITHYEKPLPKDLSMAGNFPAFIPKTDQPRLQNYPGVIREIWDRDIHMVRTLKVDGTSGTFYKTPDHFGVCSRNWELKPGHNVYWQAAKKYHLEEVMRTGMAIQGEVAGPGIQKNPMGLPEVQLFVFDILDMNTGRYWDWDRVMEFCRLHGLQTVPTADVLSHVIPCQSCERDEAVEMLISFAGMARYGDKLGEGFVYRSFQETYSSILQGRFSFKVVNNEYKD
jgi:RNA ligase (TIGR02306 family)